MVIFLCRQQAEKNRKLITILGILWYLRLKIYFESYC